MIKIAVLVSGGGMPDYNAMSDAEYYAAVLKDNK